MKTLYRSIIPAVIASVIAISAAAGEKLPLEVGTFLQKKAVIYRSGEKFPAREVMDIISCGDRVYAAAGGGLYAFDGREWKEAGICTKNTQICRDITKIECRDDTPSRGQDTPATLPSSTGPGPGVEDVRDISSGDDGVVYAATGTGIYKHNGSEWNLINGQNGGLPYEDVLAVDTAGKYLWAGTSFGAARYDGSEWQYFQGPAFLPDDRVTAVAASADGSAWVGTPGGVTHIEYIPMTLEEKAEHFERITRERHVRHGLVSDSRLESEGDTSTSVTRTSDNDGLWTAMYIAAECYRYGATGDPEAKEFARQSMDALMFLEEVNGIPGFFSRSFARPGEPHGGGEWDHLSPDGKWRWKGDTSSDEAVGHYYAYSVYYDTCADGVEKERIRDKVRLITNYIVDNDYYLIDADGEPTYWGKWNPEFFKTEGRLQRGLNSLQILSFLKTAIHITDDPKFHNAYRELILEHHYADFAVHQKMNHPGLMNHSDDELAFLSYYPLLKYEEHPGLLKKYRKSIVRSWKIEKPEKSPFFNFIYGAVMPEGTYFDVDGSVDTLKRISLDLVTHRHVNSRRADIEISPFKDRFTELQSKEVLPPDGRSVMKWNSNPYQLDDGGGLSEEAGTFWLLPYWMGRYYGFIE